MPASAPAEQRRARVLAALERYELPLVRFARRLLGDEHAAQDVVQYTFLRLCEQPTGDVEGHLAQWLFTVCRNKALDWLRARRWSRRAASSGVSQCPSHQPDPAALAEQHDLYQRLSGLVDQLPRAQREAVSLWAEGLGYREIAGVLNTTEGNVRVLMHRALKRLREDPVVRQWAHPKPEEAAPATHAVREIRR